MIFQFDLRDVVPVKATGRLDPPLLRNVRVVAIGGDTPAA